VAIDDARRVLASAIDDRVFPAATVEVGAGGGPLWTDALGTLTFDGGRPAALDTPFDLASLAKPLATATLTMRLVEATRLSLDDRVADRFPEWRGADREPVTIRDLLEHASGLAARLLDAPPSGRREFEHDICTMPLEYPPRSRSVYSDLGFILLGFLIADRGGAPLAQQFDRAIVRLKPDTTNSGEALLTYGLPPEARARTAPTRPMDDDPRRGRLLAGEVHDNYAAALGGAAGHAGLFGTSSGVGAFARIVLRAARGDTRTPSPFTPERMKLFTTRSAVPGSSRALGWDTMLPTSSCGTRMSASAFGHVGFTGTSLWIDPARDRYFVLLTNRACGGGTLDAMRDVRRAFHDALANF